MMLEKGYFEMLRERKKETHVHKDFQHTGLIIAQILGDEKHKTLYIKLAKLINKQKLLSLAKDVALRQSVSKKGAYFMKVLKEKGLNNSLKIRQWSPKKTKKSGQLKIRLKKSS